LICFDTVLRTMVAFCGVTVDYPQLLTLIDPKRHKRQNPVESGDDKQLTAGHLGATILSRSHGQRDERATG
jgi:hypothetical protein